ncbi:uncharacterized protein LOC122528070 [Frieseomelitta varia]|uniref:uncharacterized protein LOC122528070 n=1 Tax=Frieseomelitta varia TaxID=561572 RepID=UPI001CB67A2A|nr:uncharacterized protein LOC122528070 [Frieseomelitta varia]
MNNKKVWSKSEIIELISQYEEKSVLWNTKDIQYRNRETKAKIFEEFALNFSCSVEEIQRKIHNLRNQMSQELRKVRKKSKSGSGTDNLICSNWPYFQAMRFLVPVLTNDNTLSYTEASVSVGEDKTEDKAEEKTEDKNENRIQSKKRKHKNNDVDEELYKSALRTLQKEPDDYDKFGQYVALELKSLKSDFNKARLKSEIRKIIVRIADEDLYSSFSNQTSSSISTPIPSPAFESEGSQSLQQFQESCHDYDYEDTKIKTAMADIAAKLVVCHKYIHR